MTHRRVPTLLHVFPTFKVGGAQIRFIRLANHFGGDFHHLIVSMDGQAEALHLLDQGIDARQIEIPNARGETWKNLKVFWTVLKTLRPDLLVTSNWGSIEWAMANQISRIPHLHMEDGFGPDESDRQLPRRVWARRLVLRSSTVMLPSITLYRLAREVWRLPERRLVYVPNGIDSQRFTSRTDPVFAAAHGLNAEVPVIGTVAVLREEKNLGRLVKAFALLRKTHKAQLVIVGEGQQREPIQNLVAELSLMADVVFTGACSTPERLLPSFDVFALSSDTEQMPISLLEAMAAGRAVASTDVGDVRQMVADENRPYVVPKDEVDLARVIAHLLDNPAERDFIGKANAIKARRDYDQARMFNDFYRLYNGQRP